MKENIPNNSSFHSKRISDILMFSPSKKIALPEILGWLFFLMILSFIIILIYAPSFIVGRDAVVKSQE